MQKTGTEIITDALHEIRVLDPTATAGNEMLEDAQRAADYLLDEWRTQRLTISGLTISPYTLISGQQSYSIGTGGGFNQDYPESIQAWSVVPNVSAGDPLEIPMGRPATSDDWRRIRIKTQRGRPTTMYFDGRYDAGLGHCLFHPIPNASTIGVRLYQFIAAILSFDPNTTYNLSPGMTNALMLNLALALAGGYGSAAQVPQTLVERAANALASAKRRNIRPKESSLRREWVIGQAVGRRAFNIYTGGN